jgi:hypothetical protein
MKTNLTLLLALFFVAGCTINEKSMIAGRLIIPDEGNFYYK